MSGEANTHFGNGKPMQEVPQASYLGGLISNDASRWGELNNKISKALVTCSRLKTFWYKTNCSYKWKSQVYNAITVAQLTYGLSRVQLTLAMLKRLDELQMRGLRYILKIEHFYYSRISNKEVYDKINIILNKGTALNITWQEFIAANRFDKPKLIVKLSEYVTHQQNKLLGHVIRADRLDPMRLPTIDNNLNTPGVVVRKSGKPRLHWVKENCRYKNVLEKEWGAENE